MAIVALTFVLILGIVLGAYYAFVVRPERGERSRLLGRLATPKVTSQLLKPGELERPADKLSDVRAVQAVLSRAKGLSGPLERLITQSGLKITVGTLVMASVLLGCAGLPGRQVADPLHAPGARRGTAVREHPLHVRPLEAHQALRDVRRAVPGSDRADGAGAARGARISDRDSDGRRRDPRVRLERSSSCSTTGRTSACRSATR